VSILRFLLVYINTLLASIVLQADY